MKKVTFKREEMTMSAHLYLPDNFNETKTYPAVVCSHPAGGVKEQTSGLYARKLSEAGFIALAFDAAYQGESTGLPRQKEDPQSRTNDISFAIDYLQSLSYVDANRIGALGICAGGGYTVEAAKKDRRIKSVVTVSGADFGAVLRRGWLGNGPSIVEDLLLNAANQRTAEVKGAKPVMIPLAADNNNNKDIPELNEGYEYYRTKRAQYPTSPSCMPLTSVADVIGFDSYANLDLLLKSPILLVAGSKAGTLWISEEWHQKIQGKKKLAIIQGSSHFDLYDITQYVNEAVKEIVPFFKEHI